MRVELANERIPSDRNDCGYVHFNVTTRGNPGQHVHVHSTPTYRQKLEGFDRASVIVVFESAES
jgi:hypothetical protein